MKKRFIYLTMLLFGALVITSCDPDDDPPVIENPIYGMQIAGSATADEVLTIDLDQIIEPGSDFSIKEKRSGMTYGIHYLTTGTVAFKEVLPDSETTYGVSAVADSTQEAEAGEPFSYKRGELVADATDELSITEAGLYYIIVDKTTLGFWLMKINNFEISATGDKATEVAGGSADGVSFKAEAVDIRAKFKVRMNTAWKIIASDVVYDGDAVTAEDHVRMVTSYGGTLTALSEDGSDIEVDNGGNLLDFTFTWTPGGQGIADFTVTTEAAGELPPAEFPENLYMIGASIGGWTWGTNDIQMIPVHSNPHLFWRIVWLETGITDPGIKFSPEQDWGKDFGIEGDAVDGVYAKGTNNVPEVSVAGYYNVVVNLAEETIEVNPATVYGIGDAFGSWDMTTYPFTEDAVNKHLVSPAAVADNNVRMYVESSTMTTNPETGDPAPVDWWQAEFNVFSGSIEYRGTGGDQAAVAITTGQVVKLNFTDDTGVIE
jgi:hypothetical protein